MSVDIKTNFLTLYLSDKLTTFCVPNTLFFIASQGLSSISGTCLCAAAWNTISGLYCSNILSILCSSRTDAISTFKSISGKCLFISCWISYALFSYISINTSCFGSYFTICLHNSDPIEPPPPVTIIILSFIIPFISSRFIFIGSRPKRSSI